jgi:glycosyltransferase involved in cell wall biosynthesis
MYHDLKDAEILVVDNYGSKTLEAWIRNNGKDKVRYVCENKVQGVSHAKNKVFEHAKGEFVLCMDSHILIKSGALDAEIEGDNFYGGPLLYSSCSKYSLNWEPVWRKQMWGIWSGAVTELPDKPIEVWGMGAGFFACRRSSWLGFNPEFRGFGGESGYIQEKYRKAGRKVYCHPKMVWMHLFHVEGTKIPYPLKLQDRIRNYLLGFRELGLDTAPIYKEFGDAAKGL